MFSKYILITLISAAILSGCGAGPQEIDKGQIEKSTANAQLARGLFNQSNGKYDSLSAEDKKKLAEAYGSEASAQKVWATMQAPPSGGGTPGPK